MSHKILLTVPDEKLEYYSFLMNLGKHRSRIINCIIEDAYKKYGNIIERNPKAFLELYGDGNLSDVSIFTGLSKSPPNTGSEKSEIKKKRKIKTSHKKERSQEPVITSEESKINITMEHTAEVPEEMDEIIGKAGLLVDTDDDD